MSRLIDQLRAQGFPDRSQRDLTLEYGEWLEQNKRDDIFLANPDFAQEYKDLQNEIGRTRRPSYAQEFKGAFGSAVDDLQASAYGLGALAAHGAKTVGIPGAESARDKLLELMREQEAEAAEYRPSVGSYRDIESGHGLEDTARYATYGLGTLAPSLIQSAASGIAGAAVGAAAGSSTAPGPGTAVGAVGGALLGLAEKKLAQKALSRLLAQGAKNVSLAEVTRALPREAVEAEAKRLAQSIGSQAALAASSIGQQTGSIYGKNPDDPSTAMIAGVASGLLDIIPESYVMARFFKPGESVGEMAASGVRDYLKRFAVEASKTIPLEGSTESAQTLIEIAANKFSRGEDPTSFTAEDYRAAVNAGIIGSIGGAAMAPVSAIANPSARSSNIGALTDRVVEGLPIPANEEPGGAMEFGGEIPEANLTGIDSLKGPVRTEVDRAFRGDDQSFTPAESEAYSMGAEPAPAVLPKSITKAVEAADRAARAWEISHASTPETGFGDESIAAREFPSFGEPTAPMVPEIEALPASGIVQDAPLANLVGTQVEYEGYKGHLVRDASGNFMVLPPVRPNSKPFWVEIAGTGKDPSMLASQVRVVPLEPANMDPKRAPVVPIPGAPAARPPAAISKVPLGNLFPSDLVPRSDVNPYIPMPPVQPVRPPAQPPAPVPAPATAPAPTPAAAPVVTGAATQPVPAGTNTIVENTPESKLSHDAQVALWKKSNEKERQFRRLSYLPDGSPDLLNEIEAAGGLMRQGKRKGGEWDQIYEVFSGSASALLRTTKRGLPPDKLAQAVGFDHVPDFMAAVERAKAQRSAAIRNHKIEQTEQANAAQTHRFDKAIDGTGRAASKLGKPIEAGELRVGDRFKLMREPFEVVDIDPDTGDVIVNDGPRFGKQALPEGTVFRPDKRTLRRIPRSEATFLEESETETEAPAESGAVQYTIQRPQEFGGRTIPGYIQIERQANNGRGEPLTDAERAAAIQPPDWLPTGQYTEDQVKEAIAKGPPIQIPVTPKVQAAPTAQQQIQQSGNGVQTPPMHSLPNVRRLRVFETSKAPITEEEAGIMPANARAQPSVESQSVQENPVVAVDKAVGKLGKTESNVAVIIVDNATGIAFQRGAYRGANNTLYFDLGSSRKGTVTGQGSTVSPEADFLNGDEGRPAHKVLAEKAENGAPRYSIFGLAELTRPGGPRNWNLGPAAALSDNLAIQGTARKYWTEEAARRMTGRVAMPAAKSDLAAFPVEMASWRRENPGDEAAAKMRTRIAEYAALQVKEYRATITDEKLAAWVDHLNASIETMARVEQKQAVMLSADYTVAPTRALYVMRTALQSLLEGRKVDVAAYQQGIAEAGASAAKTMGMVIEPSDGKKIVAFALNSLNGPINADTVLSVLHETAHVVTDGLPEPLRVAFHEAIRELPYQKAGWLMNPRSLDIRLLANADPAALSPEQRAALETLTSQEIAAARRIDRTTLVEEQMAEHLAQLGWNHAEARGLVQKTIRFVKELWLRLAMAMQKALKGAEHTSPELARRYVENRFLQFIHRDAAYGRDRINDLKTWLGVPPTPKQFIPVFPAGNDWDQRMQYIDPATGELIPIGHAIHAPDSQLVYLQSAIANATKYAEKNPPGGPDTPAVRLTRRAAFSAPLSFTPEIQTNTVFAAINLEGEIYENIAAHPDIAPLLPVGADFVSEWLRLPDKQQPASRRADAEQWAGQMKDPTTNATIAFNADTTVDSLPTAAEELTDKNGKPVTIRLTEAQDKAIQFTIAALGDAQTRLQRRINHETDKIAELERLRKRNPADFPEAALKELDELNESLPLRQKIAEQIVVQKNQLISKFSPGDLVHIYPTAEYLTVPSPEATEAQIRASKKGVVPRDLKFTDKTTFAGHLAAMEAWLVNPDNRGKGQIYGVISETYRKLNQLPTELHRAATAGVLRRAITGGFADELRASGLPALQNLGKKFYEVAKVINEHSANAKIAGATWSEKFADFAKSVGAVPDQSFKERVYDELMRIWNFIDVSERNKVGTGDEGNLFDRIEGALRTRTDIDIKTPNQRAALRAFMLATIENERTIRVVYENNPGLKVRDEEMGIYRRLVSHGLVTGRRSVARHMSGLFMRMNPQWSATTPASADDSRTFWEASEDLFTADRAAYDAKIAELFSGYVVRDFVEPIVNNNTQVFEVQDADGIVRKASLLRVRQAWAESGGDITQFAINLHHLENGNPETQARTVAGVMRTFRRMFEEIKSDQDSKEGSQAIGMEILPRQMMDARVANDWPAEWVSYATYNEADNLQLLHQLARSAAFGPDAIAANGELSATIAQSNLDLDELHYEYDELLRSGMKPRDVEKKMGAANYGIAKNALKIKANLDRVETAFRTMSATTNYLAGDFKLLNDALGFAATMMVQNPRGTLINTSDILGSLVALKLSRPALKALKTQIHTLAADLGNGVLQAFGQNSAFNVDSAKRRMRAGVKDSDSYTNWKTKMANMGPGQSLAAPSGYESPLEKTRRTLTRFAVKGRDIIPNLGSPFQGTSEEQTLSPKLRWGGFPNWAMSTMNANIDAAYQVFVDLAERGVERINKMPTAERVQYVRELELGIRDIGADELGYFGGIILNDRAAFDSLKFALETKMAGEKSVGAFVAKAYRRYEAAAGGEWDAIESSQFADIINYANTEWTLQNNFAGMPPWMQSGPLRLLFTFLTWPYNAMRRFGKTFTDPEGRLIWWGANSTVKDGLMAFFVMAAPATIAGSFAIDWYDKYLLGKKQNLRDASWTTAIPFYGAVTDPAAFMERIGRYGSAGFATDILNQIINYDTQRNLSLDSRIVAINAIGGLVNSLVMTPLHQEGNITYSSVVRPFMQSIGGGGVLQYLQIMNNALDLNTQDAAINARINTGNYLRAAGREMNLPVRVSRGAAELPTRTTPYLQQMELAALVNNQELFRDAYRQAIAAAREDKKDNPEKYVAENFLERHPLKRIFRVAPTENEYRKLLTTMDEYGAGQVRAAINSYNRYQTNFFGKKPYYGKADRSTASVEVLINSANRINAQQSIGSHSFLAIP